MFGGSFINFWAQLGPKHNSPNKKVEVQAGESSFLFGSTISALIGTIATVVGNNRLVGYEG